MKTKPRLLLLLLLCAAVVSFCTACGDPTSATPLDTASGPSLKTKSEPATAHAEGPTPTASPTATATATATATSAPTATASPSPTSNLMPAYPRGGSYSPDTFKLIATAPCLFKDVAGSINVAFIVGASTASVTVVYSDLQGSVIDREPMGVFDHGWHASNVTWWTADRPSFAWLEAQIEGALYVSNWCAIGSY